ncbi:alpha-L-fucosidase [Streptomyces sp. NPDC088184]|uniref:alpha-L-fucosidase n=1 Tax=unclassified Streptomyces TaxID=2593676 RepID=UPI0034224D6C
MAVAATVLSLLAAAVPSVAAADSSRTSNRETQYVDCSADASVQTGSSAFPWQSLDRVNGLALRTGSRILLKRGTRCTGTLAPNGSGRPGKPLVIGAYGTGAKPVIDGGGNAETLLLKNTQWVEASGLEITNSGAPGRNKRGVRVQLEDFGTGTHYRLTGLDIHDIRGDDTKGTEGSAGILFSVTGTEKPTKFDDVVVAGNTVTGVDREGIYLASTWNNRPVHGDYDPDGPAFLPSTRVVVRGNTLKDLGGDGIVMTATDGALVERNRLDGFQRRSAGYNAGMWPWNADNTVFQYNEVSGGETTRDGMAYDVDEGTFGTVFQYNVSHDNAGGFFLVCTATGTLGDAVIRYNVSRNDHYRGIETCSGSFDGVRAHNNTVYVGDGVSQSVVNENTTKKHGLAFTNNIVVKEGAGTASFGLKGDGVTLSHNTLVNVRDAPADPGGSTADPRLTDRTGALPDGLRLHTGSPALGAGMAVAGDVARDLYGNRVPAPPNTGAYQGRGVTGAAPDPVGAAPVGLANGGFEKGLADWSTRNATASTDARTGSGALRLNAPAGNLATAEQTVSGLKPATVYELSGWIRSDGTATALGAKGYGGSKDNHVSATAWTRTALQFTTGANNTTATVYCYREKPGQASCDDLELTESGPRAALTSRVKVGFGGSFTTATGYTPSTGENVDGTLGRMTGSEQLDGGAVTLGGGGQGITYNPREAVTDGKYLTKNILSEALVRRTAGARLDFDTVLSLAGGGYYRYRSGSQNVTQFGMYGPEAPWYEQQQDGPDLPSDAYTHVALAYSTTGTTGPGVARLTAYINGCQAGTALVNQVAAADAAKGVLAFGNDAGTRNRGLHGSLDGVAVATYTGTVTPDDFQLTVPGSGCGDGTPQLPPGCDTDPGTSGPVTPSSVITVAACDRPDRIVEKAAHVVPDAKQLAWQQKELTAFVHYGMNTFTDKEWGDGTEAESVYNPTGLDPDQWMASLKAGGFKQVILTVKHHDGFLLYPSRYSDHSVKNSPWWQDGANPEGDVFGAFVKAARSAGLGVGVYLSPADGAEIPAAGHRGKGRFGNNSAKKTVTVPTLVDGDDRTPATTYTYQADDYNAYFMNQLYELLTQYGRIDEVWLDGANPWAGQYDQPYQTTDWYDLIGKIAPQANVAINGPDIRWVGTETASGRDDEWSVIPFKGDPASRNRDDDMVVPPEGGDLASRDVLAAHHPDYLAWYPAESDVSIRPGWFWHASQDGQVKTPAKLLDLYRTSVGRNSVLLLNVPPNRAGRISDPDTAALASFGQTVRATYGTNLLAPSGGSPLTDEELTSAWSPADDAHSGETVLESPQPVTFDRVVLQEDITRGQRVESFAVDIWDGTAWKTVVQAGTIGYKRIEYLSAPVTAAKVRLRVLGARANPHVAKLGLYKAS